MIGSDDDATLPWVAETPHGRDLAPLIMPCVQHRIECVVRRHFHAFPPQQER
ncbi:MAG: hypothetical protein ACKVWV_02895 [Planctomycetota bacterium]